ncbi:DNA-protecting protein DprA [Leptolyngbya iicbica LK]|uniref:DNA-protecting protein DprA n=2 Tax=Cyanophyceae TaxID=3028117 RepID=A0A4Q7EIT7_9CYAN|nr:DNA-protecting protein DprA [Leptolyngbya sp. LK]
MSQESILWFAWSQIPGLGPILQKRLAQHFGSLTVAWETTPDELLAVEGIGLKLAWAIAEHRPQIALESLRPPTDHFITPADAAYPELLYEIPDPPPILYYQGDLALLAACQHRPGVGIVGTRSPSDYGKRWTRRLTKTLCRAGFLVISGLADGIDRIAHESCLEAQGETIAVLGTGVDVVYPYRNRDLYREIGTSGLLLSEYPPGTQPEKVHFPRRNRIIAGLSRATLVTEAPRKSGALITAKLANDYGRDVFALPGSLDNVRGHGCLDILSQGAQMILREDTLVQALGAIPVEPPIPTPAPAPPPDLSPLLSAVFQAVTPESRSLDAIVQQVHDLSTGDILSALMQLELMGLISSIPGTQQYQLSTES